VTERKKEVGKIGVMVSKLENCRSRRGPSKVAERDYRIFTLS